MNPVLLLLLFACTLPAAETIETKLRVHNVGDKSFDFNTLLHTYFLIPVSLSLQEYTVRSCFAFTKLDTVKALLILGRYFYHLWSLGCIEGQGCWIEWS